MARVLTKHYASVFRSDEWGDLPLLTEPKVIMTAPHITLTAVHKELSACVTAKVLDPGLFHLCALQLLADSLVDPISTLFAKSYVSVETRVWIAARSNSSTMFFSLIYLYFFHYYICRYFLHYEISNAYLCELL